MHDQPVYYRLNGVPFVLVEPDPFRAIQLRNLSVNSRAHESLAPDLFHSIEKLPSIGGEAFDVAALAFGIKRVESQRGFPGTTQAGDNNQLFPRNFHVKVLEIVLAGTANFDNLRRHSDGECRTY